MKKSTIIITILLAIIVIVAMYAYATKQFTLPSQKYVTFLHA